MSEHGPNCHCQACVMSTGGRKAESVVSRGRGVTAILLWCDYRDGLIVVSPGLDMLDVREAGAYIRRLEAELESRGVVIEKAELGPFGA